MQIQRNKLQVHALEHEEVYSSHLVSSIRHSHRDRSYAAEVDLLGNGNKFRGHYTLIESEAGTLQ